MVSSMTGYANRSFTFGTVVIDLEIRSINHKFFDLNAKVPEELKELDYPIRSVINFKQGRGKVDFRITLRNYEEDKVELVIDQDLLRQYLKLCDDLLKIDPTLERPRVSDILRIPSMLKQEHTDLLSVRETLLNEVNLLVADLQASQAREGEHLIELIKQKVTRIEEILKIAHEFLPKAKENYRARIKRQLVEALGTETFNEQRFHQEFVHFCQKVDVDEELVRLNGHNKAVLQLLEEGGVIGKKLDFIMQELHREANTFCAKSFDMGISELGLEMKILIEQIREQVQNLF